MRRALTVLLVVTVGVVAPSCSRERDQKDALRAIINRTERLPRAFVYDDRDPERTEVAGVVEDDFRYKARLTVKGVPIEEEVVDDDTLATRFLTPDSLSAYLAPNPQNASATVIAALRTRRWVLDEVGAPASARTATDRRVEGDDPVYDAVTELQAVRDAIDRAVEVKKYSRDDIDPVYKESEDPFPKPAKGSETVRYDLRAPKLPTAAAAGATAGASIPEVAHFRKMAVYVRNDRVIEVREVIDVKSKLGDLIDAFKLPKDTNATEAIFAINQVRKGQGNAVIRVRQLTMQFSRLGEALKADVPTDTVKGSLSVLKYRGAQQPTGST